MISKQILKEIIISNEEFILNRITNVIPRKGLFFPETLKKVVILYGIRRSGKTYILYDLFKKHKDTALYIDFEDERLSDFKISDFEVLKEAFLELKPEVLKKNIVFLLDEIHNIKGWEKFIRRIVEKDNFKVFITGSSSRMMPKEIQTSLRGRSWSIEITPFSFKESLFIKNIDAESKDIVYGSEKYRIKKYFSDYLKWGGFPEVLLVESDFEKRKIIKEYLDAMFFKDLVERFNITNITLLSVLMENLFSSFSSKFSLNSFYKQYKQKLPFSKDTLFLYYKYFLDSMLVFEIKKFSESPYKRVRNPGKIYVVDSGICRKVTSDDLGRIVENVVFLELRKQGEVFYFEEEKECDFILKDFNNNFMPYQVVYELNSDNEEREIKGLVDACRYFSKRNGIILTFDQSGSRKVDGINIEILPVWQWLLLNDRDYE
ncbi:MAG: ATP-binding protein [Elusimicrobiota bacterium]